MLWCFIYMYHKEAFELWRDRNPVMRINIHATLLLNQKNNILKAKIITPIEIDDTEKDYYYYYYYYSVVCLTTGPKPLPK